MLNLIFSVQLISVDYRFYGLFLCDLVGDPQRKMSIQTLSQK